MSAKTFIKQVLPPAGVEALRGLYRTICPVAPIRFTGDYPSWADAERAATGYSAPEILAKTRAALLKVKNGEAAFERDSVVFDRMQHEFPLLAGLLRAAVADAGRLSVLDFGGALGSTYFQCRGFLSGVKELRWCVVEQSAHVACGRADFASDQLKFYLTMDECLQAERPTVLLLSSVLQYLPQPYEFLAEALRHDFDHVIVDRIGFLCDGRDRLTVQHVPAWIYKASYPAWFLSEEKFLAGFRSKYDLVAIFSALDKLDPEGGKADYKGFVFERHK